MNVRKNICIRYIPNVRRAWLLIHFGAFVIHVKNKNAPNVDRRTLGVQNSHDHSIIGVSIRTPGSATNQKLHAEKAAPAIKHTAPTVMRLRCDHLMWTRT